MENRKESESHLPEFRSCVVTGDGGRKSFQILATGTTKEWVWARKEG